MSSGLVVGQIGSAKCQRRKCVMTRAILETLEDRRLLSAVVDLDFGGNGSGGVLDDISGGADAGRAVVALPNGSLLVAGTEATDTGAHLIVVRRYLADGSVDPSFAAGAGVAKSQLGSEFEFFANTVGGMAVDGEGRILVVGSTTAGWDDDIAVVRFTADGLLDTTFGEGDGVVTTNFTNLDGVNDANGASAVLIQPDGKIVVGGYNIAAGKRDFALARYDTLGNLDASFSDDGWTTFAFAGGMDDELRALALDASGGILAGGRSVDEQWIDRCALARFNADGTLDGTFNTTPATVGYVSAINSIVVDADGSILAAGSAVDLDLYREVFLLARYAADGSVLSTTTTALPDPYAFGNRLTSLAIQPDGKILAVGVANDGSWDDTAVVRYAPTDAGFDVDSMDIRSFSATNDAAYSATLQDSDGLKLVIGGTAWNEAFAEDFFLARYTLDVVPPTGGGGTVTATLSGPELTVLGANALFTVEATSTGGGGGTWINFIQSQNRAEYVGGALAAAASGGLTFTWTVNGVVQPVADSAFSFAPSVGGVYTISVTVSNGQSSVTQTMQAVIGTAGIVNGNLLVAGTTGSDLISLVVLNDRVTVLDKIFILGTFNPTGAIRILGGAGDDILLVVGKTNTVIELQGGAGDDLIKGSGNDILVGGDGDDLLVGGNGSDILIGGNGADRLVGSADDDILIAGTSVYDDNSQALRAILNEWNSPASYATRVNNIRNGQNLAAGYALRTFDDQAMDMLTGSSGVDWFVFNSDGLVRDKVTDLKAAEFASDLDFILA